MASKTKNDVLRLVQAYSTKFDTEPAKLNATNIAHELHLSRSLASMYLNELCEESYLSKINTRPVIFVCRSTICKRIKFMKSEYDNIDDLKVDLGNINNTSNAFDTLIGVRGSLQYVVQRCKSAITYPGIGLPTMLLGDTGVGKSYIASLMFQYGLDKGVFTKDARFLTLNCSEYANNPELFLTNLFGCKRGAYTGAENDTEGLIHLADQGLLFLDEVHCLPAECQEKLFLFMDKGIYHVVGDNDKWYKAKEHLVFATTEDPHKSLLKTFYRRIPIVINIPNLSQRPSKEKKQLIAYIIEQESKNIKKEIRVSQRLLDVLTEYEYKENVGQIVNIIKSCVANAYSLLPENFNCIVIDMVNLPEDIIKDLLSGGKIKQYVNPDILTIKTIEEQQKQELPLFSLNTDIIKIFDANKNNYSQYIELCEKRLVQYLDDLSFSKTTYSKEQEIVFRSLIENESGRISENFDVSITNSDVINISRILSDYYSNCNALDEMMRDNQKEIDHSLRQISINDQYSYSVTNAISSSLCQINNLKFENLELLDLNLYVKAFMLIDPGLSTECIILSHGYSTASSIAACVNTMVGKKVFDAIDMPIEMNVNAMVYKLDEYLSHKKNLQELIVLVDMGSLEDIYENIVINHKINLAVFNNVSMKLALDIATKTIQGISIKDIRNSVDSEDFSVKSIYVENIQKERIILSICSTGINIANKISNLINDSLPAGASVRAISYSYESVANNKESALVFAKYDVKLIVGNINPGITMYPFVSIEEILDKESVDHIRKLFSDEMEDSQYDYFEKNIIRNFSLNNLINYLTILNPEKILNSVDEIINTLQKNLKITMKANTIVGLDIHISCLIERLVTDKYITNYSGIQEFERTQERFISIVKNSFKKVCEQYNIDIPVSEIAYIYDYIYQNDSVEKMWFSVESNQF